MNANLKKFMAHVEKDDSLKKKIIETSELKSEEAKLQATIELAKSEGFELTADDLQPCNELDDDELMAVSGGGPQDPSCACPLAGGGQANDDSKACGCVLGGGGANRDGSTRCACPFIGFGV